MKKCLLLVALAILSFYSVFAQSASRAPLEIVNDAKRTALPFQETSIFKLDNQTSRTAAGIENSVQKYNLFDVDLTQLQNLGKEQPLTIKLQIPINFSNSFELELVKVNIFTPDFQVIKASDKAPAAVNTGLHYRGIIKGDESSIAAISIFDNEIMGLVSSKSGNIVIGKLQNRKTDDKHIIYDDENIIRDIGMECGTVDDGIGYTNEDLSFKGTNAKTVGDCIRLYIEVDHNIFLDKGGVNETIAFVAALTNEVTTIYANEGIQAVVSEVFVWNIPSPYNGGDLGTMRSQFQENTDGFNGDLGQLISYQLGGSGIAAGFAGICNPDSDQSLSFAGITSTFEVVPTYSFSVFVMSHEFGHLWGSRHTHACVWNGNNTAIDGCSGSTEGTCPLPENPIEGGTIMSYCNFSSAGVGINFNLGFGPQPGNVIRNSVANATCTTSCGPASCDDGFINGQETGIDCGGPDCIACPTCEDGIQNGKETGVDCGGPNCPTCPCLENTLSISITFDNFPEETSWDLKSNGVVIASGGPYEDAADRSTILENVCLSDGCYEFTIYDEFGDGICCTYGPGSYTLTNQADGAGDVIVSNNDIDFAETTPFCIGGDPTCDDGIQNGQETGVDCGGPDCPSCPVEPSCDDGIQNGQETGVDCGGPDCPSCPTGPTCDDGIQNGQETGVDCGGPDCPTCPTGPTCDDGIQNGQETGVDCGGPDCPTCPTGPTCDDGIQNGQETGVDCGGPDCVPCGGCTPQVIDFNDFDDTWGIWIDGGSDCRRSIIDADYAITGMPVRLRDNSSSSVMTTSNLNLSAYQEISVDFSYITASMDDPSHDFWLQISLDGGNTFSTVEEWNLGDEFENDIRYFETVIIPGPFTATTQVRFRCDAGSDSDYLYLDNVSINTCTGGSIPTCNDGIQNGQETGVDCGGPTCPSCPVEPTCEDGIQNGQETGVDCGGPDCPSCPVEPTCEDGIQNGQETGVDCGGPDCPSCPVEPTCDDGIQNGQETGVDCGGPDCPSCPVDPTCNDGIQNGQETGVDCGGPDCVPCATDCTTTQLIDFNDFNTTWGIWNDGGTDCRRSVSDSNYDVDQTGIPVRLRDNTSSSVMTTNSLNLAAFQALTVDFSYITVSMDGPAEDFWLQVSTDGGTTFTTVEEWNFGDEFENDVRYFESVTIPGPFTANTQLRFRCDASTDADEVYIDNVNIAGCLGGSSLAIPGEIKTDSGPEFLAAPQQLSLFPNPVNRGELNISFTLVQQGEIALSLTDLQGKVMGQRQFLANQGQTNTKIDVSQYPAGIYVVHLVTKSGRLTEKFVVIK
ncbi:MAG: zinc-dependent metalloprotease [Saprospiraceae bacterium]